MTANKLTREPGSPLQRVSSKVVAFVFVFTWAGVISGPVFDGSIEAPVAVAATAWLTASVLGALLLPPRHGRPLEEYATYSQNDGAPSMYRVAMSPFSPVRILYALFSYLHAQSTLFLLGSIVFGTTEDSAGAHDRSSRVAATVALLVGSSILAVSVIVAPVISGRFLVVAHVAAMLLPISASRDALQVLRVNPVLAASMLAVAIVAGLLLGINFYWRNTCMTSFSAAGALVVLSTSWRNVIDPTSRGPYVRVVMNLVIWCVFSLIALSCVRRRTVAAWTIAAVGLSLAVSLSGDRGSMPTYAATLVLAGVFGAWIVVYDTVQYSTLLKQYIDEQAPGYNETASGAYLVSVFHMDRLTSF